MYIKFQTRLGGTGGKFRKDALRSVVFQEQNECAFRSSAIVDFFIIYSLVPTESSKGIHRRLLSLREAQYKRIKVL